MGQILLNGNSLSVLNNLLAGSDILNDLDIQIGDEDTLSDLLGLVNLLPGPGNGGGDDDDDEEEEDVDADVLAAGAVNTVKPSSTAKPASGPDLVGAAVLEHPTSLADPLVEVAGAQETAPAPSRGGPLPRTGGPAGLAGMAAALLGSSGALRLMIRRRRDDSS